jgi:putative membrane protein
MKISNLVTNSGCLVLFAAGVACAATLSNADRQFLVTAAKTDMTEAHEGQMAENQAVRPDVKAFAKTLVDDHTASYTQLSELAAKTGVAIPKGINVGQNRAVVQLVHLKGDRFDRQFTTDEIAGHRQMLATFKREAKQARDADVKAYATKMIPTLEKHLQLAEQCAKPAKHT